MLLRKATPEDSKTIASFLFQAMDELFYKFIGERSLTKATLVLELLVSQKGNQYSYENCWIIETMQVPTAAVCCYDGANLDELRKPVVALIKSLFNHDFNPENETQAGEWYIDSIGVDPKQRGKGIGATLIGFLIDEYAINQHKTLGLLVEKANPNAKKLYLKLGFEVVGEKMLMGEQLEHLQYKSN